MPAHDVRYVLDGSLEHGHIGADTHFYMMELEPKADDIVDNHQDRTQYENYWQGLANMGLYYENFYVNWRAENPGEAKLASHAGLFGLPNIFREVSRTCASEMDKLKFRSLNRDAIAHLDKTYGLATMKDVMRRTLHRAHSDFQGWTGKEITDLQHILNGKRADNAAAFDAMMQRMMANMHTQVEQSLVMMRTFNCTDERVLFTKHRQRAEPTNTIILSGVYPATLNDCVIDPIREARRVKEARQAMRERMDSDRRVLKRSVKFLSKLVGHETTRMFIGGHGIRFEGKYAIYELKKMSSLRSAHGGFRALSVFSKENPDLLLCNLCITTSKVPLLDHVASLIMHIQSGHEDEILTIGNAVVKDDVAYQLPWLAPHLPKKRDPDEVVHLDRLFGNEYLTPKQMSEREERIGHLRQVVARHLYDEVLADFIDVLNRANVQFTMSHPKIWVTVPNSTATNVIANPINLATVPMAIPPEIMGLDEEFVD